MEHPIIQDLKQRYTTKRYDSSKRVSQDKLDVLYRALQLSPSSINSQPWKFIVINSDEAKQRMYDTFERVHQYNRPHVMAASQIILFAHNPKYTRADYAKVVDQTIIDDRIPIEERESAFRGYFFAEDNTDENGYNGAWTMAQTYLALGNALHVLARLGVDATPMEGVDSELIGKMFAKELDGYVCHVALAIGYHDSKEDYNAKLPKSRLPLKEVVKII